MSSPGKLLVGRRMVVLTAAIWLLSAAARPASGSTSARPVFGALGSPGVAQDLPPSCPEPLQDLLDRAADGAEVRLPNCTSTETLVVRHPVVIDAQGTVIDGQDDLEHGVIVTADDVVIRGVSVTRVANPAQDGAVQAWDVQRFTFEGGSIQDSAGACISVARSPDASILDSTLIGCGQEGIHATRADRLIVRGNTIAGNNPRLAFDPEWEAGGLKVTRSADVLLDGNEVHDNRGPGIWCDIECRDVEVRGNKVWANDRAGIHIEISDGALVTGNAVWENGWARSDWGWGAGILISSARNVTVTANVLAWNADGIVVVSQDRQDAPAPISNVRTSDNVVASEAGRDAYAMGWLQDWPGVLFEPASANGATADVFWFNSPEDGRSRFAWDGSKSTLDAFRATPGGLGASYASDAAIGTIVRDAGMPTEPTAERVGETRHLPDVLPVALIVIAVGSLAGAVVAARHRRKRTFDADTDQTP